VRLTRETDERVPLYARCEAADGGAHGFFISLHCNRDASPAARGAATYYFQRSHYYSEHGRRLAGYVGARLDAAGAPWLGRFGRNYGILRETRAIALLVEPLFLSSAEDEQLARRPEHVEKLARALAGGLADYLARVPLEDETP
jgi:N-acetylmuramoyl-L-alanine amidase